VSAEIDLVMSRDLRHVEPRGHARRDVLADGGGRRTGCGV
jgi:hypothetical protein